VACTSNLESKRIDHADFPFIKVDSQEVALYGFPLNSLTQDFTSFLDSAHFNRTAAGEKTLYTSEDKNLTFVIPRGTELITLDLFWNNHPYDQAENNFSQYLKKSASRTFSNGTYFVYFYEQQNETVKLSYYYQKETIKLSLSIH
jgi:hypothetical protein